MFFPLRSNLPTSPFTAAHHASRLALTLMASLLLAACGSSTPAPATPTPTPLLAPNLGTVSAQTYTQDTDITPLVFDNSGGDAASCTIGNPGLPTGLMVRVFADSGKMTCRIFGTPTELVSPARMVTITATNTAGSDTATVSITVNPAATLIAPTNLAPLVSGSQSPGEGIVIASNGVALMQNSCVFSSSGQTSQTLDGLKLITDASGCRITGTPTPTASATSRSYTILAVSVNGDDLEIMITLMVLPAPAAPDLPDGAVTALVVDGASVGTVTIANTGDNPNTCQFVDPAGDTDATLVSTLDGISVTVATNNTDCEITGALTGTGTKEFTVRATNATGSDNATVQFTVNPVAPNLSSVNAQVYTPNTDITPLVFDNTGGGDLTECSVNNPLPNGLSVAINAGKDSCVITGIPDTVTSATDFEITATNDTGSSTIAVSITINLAAPNLSSVNAQVYTPNTDITPLVFANTGGGNLMRCSASSSLPSGSLPSGLMVTTNTGNDSCVITGIPDTVTPATDYKITAANVTGSDTVTVPITVSSGIVPDSLSGQNLFRYEAGQTVPVTRQITFTNFGGDLTSCTVPDMIDGMPNGLPDGMSIDFDDCAISGAPFRIAAQTTTHTITAMHMDDTTSTATISIETYLSAPPSLSDYSGVTLVMGSAVGLPIVLENTGGLVGDDGCQVASDNTGGERPLSNFGLEVAVTAGSSSCEIRATDTVTTPPTATVEGARYSITATNDLGVSGAVATFTIIAADDDLPAPTLTVPTPNTFTFPINRLITTPINFTPISKLGICTISPALPDGLRFDPSTCQISGTPRTASMMTEYTVTALNKTSPADAENAVTATVDITVTNATDPSLESMVALNLTMNSNVGLPFAIANTGGNPTDCAAAPTTTDDDDLDSYNLTVLVADGTCVIDSRDGNGPSRTLDGGSFTITASGTPASAATLTLNLRTPATPQISAGNDRTYAINSAGQLFGWGSNFSNQLGLGDLDDFLPSVSTPTPLTGNGWVQVSAGSEYTCAINASGQLWCWGLNNFGQLGLGNNNDTNIPTQVGADNDWAQVGAGQEHTCAIKASGQLWCWGSGGNGQLGLGNNSSTGTPTRVGEDEDWAQVDGGADHTCAIKTSGQLWCWGDNFNGQLGVGGNTDTDTPGMVGGADEDWMQVSAGAAHTCAIKAAGQLFCWGSARFGRLGFDTGTSRPKQVGGDNGASDWMQVSAGSRYTCAIKEPGQLWCWGDGKSTPSDDFNSLGLGNNSSTGTPTRVGEDEDWMQVNTGSDYRSAEDHTCAIKASEQLWCWGNGGSGQLGLGSNTSTNTPAFVRGNPALTPLFAPDLRDASAQTYTQKTTITNLVFTNDGGDVTASTGCAVDTSDNKPDLPDGLSVEVVTVDSKRTCRITGMPTEVVSPARMVTITATNVTDSSSVTVSITVNLAVPNLGTVGAQVYVAGSTIPNLVLTNTGGDVTASTGCAVATSGGLPAGLSVGVVTDDNGKRTCQITGAPDAPMAATDYEITATNTTNITAPSSVIVSITVHSGIMPVGSSAENLFRYEAGRTTTREITFSNPGGDIQSCTVPNMIDGMPNGLPDGMMINSINTTDCTISGAPFRITAETTDHTITAMYTNGTTSMTTISIETYLSARPLLSDYSGVTLADGTLVGVTLVAGSTVGLPIVLQNTGGMVGENGCQTSFSSDAGRPPLSSFGLVLAVTANNSSCEIKAIATDPADPAPPTGTLDKAVYTIRATNDLGVSEASVTFTIIGADASLDAPTLTAPAGSPFMFATNAAITPIDFAPSDKLGICTISPALPDGLRFDRSTCQISGTPRKALAMMTTYTVTATNKASPAATLTNTATVDITVTNAAPPSLESMIDLNLTMNSNAGLPFAIANTGGSPTSCTTAPTTAGDDALASYNLTVLVADGTCVIDSLDGNGPSRTLDGGSFTITPSSGAASTLTLNLRTPITPQITAGDRSTCAINSARQLFCWGTSPGLDNPGNTSTPTLLAGNDWAQVSAGNVHTCVINTSGQLWCWGGGGFGQLGLGNNSEINIPTQVLMPMGSDQANDDWMQVSAGSEHTCAIKAAGELWCWGEGDFGRLGLGSNTDTNTPMQVGGDDGPNNWMQVSAGGDHTCAINTSGELWCWGEDANGRLGLGDDTDINTPMQVGGDDGPNNWMQVSAGGDHTCAINTSGELWCWGAGGFGRLGLGSNTDTNTPMQVGGDDGPNNWMQVSAGGDHTCAINTSGQLFCWGFGGDGRLGLGDNNNADTPTQVGTAMDWTQAGASSAHTCAIKTSGQLFCWGAGSGGQLGLGSDTDMNVPTRVPGILLQ